MPAKVFFSWNRSAAGSGCTCENSVTTRVLHSPPQTGQHSLYHRSRPPSLHEVRRISMLESKLSAPENFQEDGSPEWLRIRQPLFRRSALKSRIVIDQALVPRETQLGANRTRRIIVPIWCRLSDGHSLEVSPSPSFLCLFYYFSRISRGQEFVAASYLIAPKEAK